MSDMSDMSDQILNAFEHLDRLSDGRGLFEHAKRDVRREEHGYCTDDNARLLVVTTRERGVRRCGALGQLALRFVLAAQDADGRCRNRMDRYGCWTDEAGTDDCWGRSVWALGAAAAAYPERSMRSDALGGFDIGVRQRSRWPRAMAFAALGAADVVAQDGSNVPARLLLEDALELIGFGHAGEWCWPEGRLRYANAALAEAVIAAGAVLDDDEALDRGLAMLGWLLDRETSGDHLSVTGVDGRGPLDCSPQFDQQAIEVAAIADACWRAYHVTGDAGWTDGIVAAARWFEGVNDIGAVMYDARSGGGYDGLQRHGVNLNQGAESTLAVVSTMQRARFLVGAA
jgi:hypothetical protein